MNDLQRPLCVVGIAAFLLFLFPPAVPGELVPLAFERAMNEAASRRGTAEGRAYGAKADAVLQDVILRGVKECMALPLGADSVFTAVFYVEANGRVKRVYQSAANRTAQCFTRKIMSTTFPRPPHAHWPVTFGINSISRR